MQIVIVSSDHVLGYLSPGLREAGLSCQRCGTLAEASELLDLYPVDLVLLESGACGTDGSALRRFRAANAHVPIAVFGARLDSARSIALFAEGVDDVFEGPVMPAVMAARIRAIVRRCRGCDGSAIVLGPLRFDMIRRSLTCDGVPITLTAKEYQILEILLTRKGSMLSKEALLDQVYGSADAPMVRIIDVYVCRLRKKLAEYGVHDVIETVRGLGYMVVDRGPAGGPAGGSAGGMPRRTVDARRAPPPLVHAAA